jgi:hypothetical protein
LALDDKDYLPLILNKIATKVKKETGRDFMSMASMDGLAAFNLPPFAAGKTATLSAKPNPNLREDSVNAISNRDLTTNVLETRPQKQDGIPPAGSAAKPESEPGNSHPPIDPVPPVIVEGTRGIDDDEELKVLLSRFNCALETARRSEVGGAGRLCALSYVS